MDTVTITSPASLGCDFIPDEYLPEGQDEYYLRNSQLSKPMEQWRHLRSHEVELLVKNSNYADDWDEIRVTDEFDPGQIRNTEFFGFVRIAQIPSQFYPLHVRDTTEDVR